jgi:hypothetical protein
MLTHIFCDYFTKKKINFLLLFLHLTEVLIRMQGFLHQNSNGQVCKCAFHYLGYIKQAPSEKQSLPIPVSVRSKAKVCGRPPSGIGDSNPAGCKKVSCECCVLSSIGLCDGLITRSEESYRVRRV